MSLYKKLELEVVSVTKRYSTPEEGKFTMDASFKLKNPEVADDGMLGSSHGTVLYSYEFNDGDTPTEEDILALIADEPGVVSTY